MESAGPTTRSRARGGSTAMPASAAKAPSTRKKAAPRSARMSVPARMPPASPPKAAGREAESPVEDADDTAAAADIPEAAAHADAHMSEEGADAEPRGTPAHPASAIIAGLTPMMDQAATPGASPAGYGPSPVMPIKLDSLWTPGTAQHTSSSPYAAFSPLAAPQGTPQAQDIGLAQDNSTVDLASMFISTPAAAPGSSSPIEGVIAADEAPAAAAAAAAPATEPIAARPQQETPSANDSVLMGSPAPPGAFAFAELAPAAGRTPGSPAALPPAGSRATPEPSAPLLPQGQPGTAAIPGTPGWSQDTDLPPARSPSFDTQAGATPGARATPGSVRGPAPKSAAKSAAKRTPGGTARKSGTPGPSPSPLQDSSPMPPAGPPVLSDMESPMPPAGPPVLSDMESPMPPAGPPVLSDMESPMPPAGSPMLETDDDDYMPPACSPMCSLAGTPAAPSAAKAKTPLSVAQQQQQAQAQQDTEMGEPAAQQQQQQEAPLQKYEAFEAVLLESAAKEMVFLEGQLQAVPTDSASTEQDVCAARSALQHQEEPDVSMMDTAGSEEVSMEAAAAAAHGTPQAAAGIMDLSFGSPAAAGGSPAATGLAGAETRTPHNTPAAATLGGDGTVTSPGARYRSSSATTAVPPKSALAKPKSGSSSAAPKHAHVVVPDAASPKTTPTAKSTAGRHAPGSAAARFTDTQKQQAGGSPGHTPFPSKAKVRAATAAATSAAAARSAAAAAAAGASKAPSHKKEMALAAAHSALKRYSKAAGDAVDGSPDGGRWQASGSPSPTIPHVSSRLMQPTASSTAKSRYSGASDGPDAHMWSPPVDAPAAEASGHMAGSSRPRLASKIVVPSPAAAPAAPSLKALKRSIKSKVEQKAQATLQEGMADAAAADVVRSSKLGSSSSSASRKVLKASQKAAAAAAEEELDLDTYDDEWEEYYEEEEGGGDVDALADSLAGLSVKPIKVAAPQGLLKGVAAPAGRHFKFDEAGNPMETPVSRQRRPPTHIKFDDDGNPIPAMPRWR